MAINSRYNWPFYLVMSFFFCILWLTVDIFTVVFRFDFWGLIYKKYISYIASIAFSQSLPSFHVISHDVVDVRAQLAKEKLTFGVRIGRNTARLS